MSAPRVRRHRRGNRRALDASVFRRKLDGKTLTALFPPPAQHFATPFCFHPSAEAMRAEAPRVARPICRLAHRYSRNDAIYVNKRALNVAATGGWFKLEPAKTVLYSAPLRLSLTKMRGRRRAATVPRMRPTHPRWPLTSNILECCGGRGFGRDQPSLPSGHSTIATTGALATDAHDRVVFLSTRAGHVAQKNCALTFPQRARSIAAPVLFIVRHSR